MVRIGFLLLAAWFVFGSMAMGAQMTSEFSVEGQGKNGLYKTILAKDGTNLHLSRKTQVINAGGILVEGNPIFTGQGNFSEKLPVSLKIVPEDILVDIGGIQAVARVDYHVSGTIGKKSVKVTIVDDHPVSEVDNGLRVQTGFRKQLKGLGATFEAVSVVKEVSGINVETERYHTLSGSSATSLRMNDFARENFTVSGSAEPWMAALVVALRPFLLQ